MCLKKQKVWTIIKISQWILSPLKESKCCKDYTSRSEINQDNIPLIKLIHFYYFWFNHTTQARIYRFTCLWITMCFRGRLGISFFFGKQKMCCFFHINNGFRLAFICIRSALYCDNGLSGLQGFSSRLLTQTHKHKNVCFSLLLVIFNINIIFCIYT